MTAISTTAPPPAARNVARPLVLGIESSCDETAVALVAGDRTILAQAIASQEEEHAP